MCTLFVYVPLTCLNVNSFIAHLMFHYEFVDSIESFDERNSFVSLSFGFIVGCNHISLLD